MPPAPIPDSPIPDGTVLREVQEICAIGDPIIRNFRITLGYQDLARALVREMGDDAEVNWCTFAVWASRQAGNTIRGEDLRRTVVRILGADPAVLPLLEAVIGAARTLGSPRTVNDLRRTLGDLLDLDAMVARAADAVARGNLRVFQEVGSTVARFLESSTAGYGVDPGGWLEDGDPPGGQGYLRRALGRYAALRGGGGGAHRAQLLLLGNLEIGYHEQIRVQPEIEESVDVLLPPREVIRDRVTTFLFPGRSSLLRLRSGFWRWMGRKAPLDEALDRLVDTVGARLRGILTRELMTLDLAGTGVLRLGDDLVGDFPASLSQPDHPDLVELLGRIDHTPHSLQGTGARDWSDAGQRIHFIADLFRRHQETPGLLSPPYRPDQVTAIRAGRLPPGPL